MEDLWQDVAERVKDLSSKPEKFLEPSDSIFEKTKILAKVLYDAAKIHEDGKFKSVTLPELIIENFDEEQVWAGVELQNAAFEADYLDRVKKLEALSIRQSKSFDLVRGVTKVIVESDDKDDVEFDDDGEDSDVDGSEGVEEGLDGEDEEVENEDGEDSLSEIDDTSKVENGGDDESSADDEMAEILKDPDFANMSDSDKDDLPLFGEKDSDDSDANDFEEEEEKERKRQEERERREIELTAKADDYLKSAMKTLKSATVKPKSDRELVEDRFFKLDEMEKFLESEEAKERQEISDSKRKSKDKDGDSEDDDDDDDEVDLFDSRLTNEKKLDRAMYSDYFNELQEEEENEADEEDSDSEEPLPKRLLLDDDDGSDDEAEDLGEMKSAFELRSAKLKKEIRKLENEAVSGDKPWQMIGEVNAVARPENSLLQEHLEYDHVAKKAPIVTEEVTHKLEDLIIQRIKDQAFDDVVRKIKPVENPYEYKKKLILDQEKSKLSLAEVYEQEYLKQKGDLEESKKTPGVLDDDADDGPPPEVELIKRSMKTLFAKLDTLTHFHYTPKMSTAEVKIIRNAPTISMEEVAPIAMSDANLLAPQEIVDKKLGEEIGATERSETDRKRDRRLKKLKQRLREKEREKKNRLVEKLNPGLGNKHSKKKVLKDIERAEKEGKVVTIKSKSKSVKSSTSFFQQLQIEASATLKDQLKDSSSKKKEKKNLNAASLKL